MSFNERYKCVTEIVDARNRAIQLGKINEFLEPFKIEAKEFLPINKTEFVSQYYVFFIYLAKKFIELNKLYLFSF